MSNLPTPSSSASDAASPTTRSRVASSLPVKRLDLEAIDELLSQVPSEFLQAKDFNPFAHYDDSVSTLTEYHDLIRDAIDHIVDVHHKGFNTATAAFSHVVDSFASSQQTVGQLLSTLGDSRRLLTSRSEHLKEYWTQTQVLTHINHSLSKLSYLQSIPLHLSTLTSSKLYLHSVILLTHTLHLMSEEDLREVEGLLELREELLARKNSISDLLIHELHHAVYHAQHSRDNTKAPTDAGEREDSRDDSAEHSRIGKEASTSRLSGTPAAAVGEGGAGAAGRKEAVAAAPASSPAATLSFLASSAFSPFHSSSAYVVDPAGGLAQDSPVFVDPAYRSLAHLLAEERSPAFLAHPLSSTSRLLSLLVAALDHLNALPAAKTQITRRVRAEVTAIIDREKTAIRDKMKGRTVRRRPPAGVSSAAGAGSRLPRVPPAEGDRLALFLSRLFPLLQAVLRHHMDLIHLINLRLLIRTEASHAGVATQGKKPTKGKVAAERDDPRWSLGSVWETVQIEVQVALQDVLFSAAGGPSQSLKLSSSAKKASNELELSFSFDDSNAPSIVRMSRGKEEKTAYERQLERRASQAQQKAELLAIVTPSPYHVTTIYRPVLAFTQQVAGLVYPRGVTPPASQLMGFLSLFIASSFLPRLQADVNIEVDSMFEDSHAFDAVEAPLTSARRLGAVTAARDAGPRGLSRSFGSAAPPLRLRCVMAAADLLEALLADVASLPNTVGEYIELMEAVVGRVQRACEDRYGEACRGVYSASRLLNVQVRRAMEEEAAYQELIMQQPQKGAGEAAAEAELSSSHPLYGPFLSPDFSLRSEQLLSDPRALTDVCLIAESVEWLADQLYLHCQHHMAAVHTQAVHSGARRRGKAAKGKSTKSRTRLAPSPPTLSSPAGPLPSFRLEESQALEEVARLSSFPRSPVLDATVALCKGLLPLCQSLVGLATRCVLTLRLELRCHLFAALSQMRYSSYALPTKPSEPELFILHLATALAQMEDACTRLMSEGLRAYLQSGVISLASALVIALVAQLQDKRMTRDGVHQLHVDLFALHQLLIGLRVGGGALVEGAEGEAFDRAVYYLDLLLLSEEELMSGDHTNQFPREAIKAIQSLVRTPLRDAHLHPAAS